MATTSYWVGNHTSPYNWSNVNNWASTTGGIGGSGIVPLSTTNAIFDDNANSSVTVDVAAVCYTLVSNAFNRDITLNSGKSIKVNSATLATGTVADFSSFTTFNCSAPFTSSIYVYGNTIFGTCTMPSIWVQGGDISLTAALVCSGYFIFEGPGSGTSTFSDNGYDFTFGGFQAYDNNMVLNISSTWTATSNDTVCSTAVYPNNGYSPINTMDFSTQGDGSITVNNSSGKIQYTDTSGNTLTFNDGNSQTWFDLYNTGLGSGTWYLMGCDGSTFNILADDNIDGHNLQIQNSTTITVSSVFKAEGTSCSNYINIVSDSPGTQYTINTPDGEISGCHISDFIASTPITTTSCKNVTPLTNSGLTFNSPCTATSNTNFFFLLSK